MSINNALTPFPYLMGQLNNISPLTYRDGATYLKVLEKLIAYVQESLTPELSALLEKYYEDFQEGIKNSEDTIIANKNDWQNLFDEFMVNITAEIALLNDAAFASNVTSPSSLTHSALTNLLVTKESFDSIVQEFSPAIDDVLIGRLTDVTLDGKYLTIDTAGNTYTTPNAVSTIVESITSPIELELSNKSNKDSAIVDVKDHGAMGDGVTDDTDAFNTAIAVANGGTVMVPRGTYMINAIKNVGPVNQPYGIGLTIPGTVLNLGGATLQTITNNSGNYSTVQISAPNCSIIGGVINGDVLTHTGVTGEWGHCIDITENADRARVVGTHANLAWGDGIFILGRCVDVVIDSVVCDNNRRQGMSIIDAIRPRVVNSVFSNTGQTKFTAPSAGLDIEPDPGTTRDVIDMVISGCTFINNRGSGFLAVPQGRVISGVVDNCVSINNNLHGYEITEVQSPVGKVGITYTGCKAVGNTSDGFSATGGVREVTYQSCSAYQNTLHGFFDGLSDSAKFIGCESNLNKASGFYFDSRSTNAIVNGCSAVGNCISQPALANFDISGKGFQVSGCSSSAGVGPAYPAYAYAVRLGAENAQLMACTAFGAFNTRPYFSAEPLSIAVPVPGDMSSAVRASFTRPKTIVSDAPIALTDSLIISNGATVTSLPTPTVTPAGQQFIVKNISATSISVIVQGTGFTIDGTTNKVLARYEKATFVTNGQQYYTI